MSQMQELIDTADRLCATLESAANNELKMIYEAQIIFDKWQFQMNRMRAEIQCIKDGYYL